MQNNDDIVLIGGATIDYLASPKKAISHREINKAVINYSFGGVMSNISINLSKLGIHALLLTSIGEDRQGKLISDNLKCNKVDVISPFCQFPSASYIEVNDTHNDMEVGIIDDRAFDCLNSSFIKEQEAIIKRFKTLVIDSNLSEETLCFVCNTFKDQKIIAEGVSTNKIVRLRKFLPYFYLLSCNFREAKSLLSNDSLTQEEAAKELLKTGLKNVIITNGAECIIFGTESVIMAIPVNKERHIINTTGCGDALFSGVLTSIVKGHSILEGIDLGKRLSSIILQTPSSSSNLFSKFNDWFERGKSWTKS
jgi:pseudouridine kinase